LGLVKSIPFLTFDPFAAQLLSVNQGYTSGQIQSWML
jgi:hypothetical protein